MFYAERFPNPTRASRPRQLPTDHVHAVPTREYQSDQSSRMLLRCYRPCCPKQNKLKAHQQERVPTGAPVECVPSARTVLTVEGSLRRAKQRRALDCCAPFRPTSFPPAASAGNPKRSAKNKTRQPTRRGLDRVAPYQNRIFRPNWTWRGEFSCVVTTPKVGVLTVAPGAANSGVFIRLNASPRNSSLARSVTRNRLK